MGARPGYRSGVARPVPETCLWVLGAVGVLGAGPPGASSLSGLPPSTSYYSTAAPPRDYVGPVPVLLLARNDPTTARPDLDGPVDRSLGRAGTPDDATPPADPAATAEKAGPKKAETPRVASRTAAVPAHPASDPSPAHASASVASPADAAPDPIALAKKAIADCQARYLKVQDYTCTFHKRERIDGALTVPHVMAMKMRSHPASVYFKFQQPNKGREAIYVVGRHQGKVIAHDVGFGKFLAGTMKLDPKGSMAMEDNRHPITEAGIGALIETVSRHWAVELTPAESKVVFHPNMNVGNRPCTMIESIHPRHQAHFLHHIVKLYIDQEHGLPIRFEAYDWPKHPGAAPELVEEYTYTNLRTNVGLRDQDFDPGNPQYTFGRF